MPADTPWESKILTEVSITEARQELADFINRVLYAGERFVILRHGKPVAEIVAYGKRAADALPDSHAGAIGIASDTRTTGSKSEP